MLSFAIILAQQLISSDGVPAFTATGNPELDDVLLSMRQTHFIPAYLSEPERRMIFGTKHRQQLLDNPQSVIIGDEEIELKWIDRRKEIPNRTKLFHKAISLMSASSEGGHEGEAKAWENLPALLTGLKKAHAVPPEKAMAKIVRKAVGCGRIGIIIQCLHQVEHTGMSLQMPEVLNNVIYGLRTLAQKDGWSEEALGKALKDSQQIAILLEMKEHGGGGIIKTNDARGRKEVIGVFLELAAMHAYKFQNGKDVDGKVKMYAERLMDRLEFASQVCESIFPPSTVLAIIHDPPLLPFSPLLTNAILSRQALRHPLTARSTVCSMPCPSSMVCVLPKKFSMKKCRSQSLQTNLSRSMKQP